MYHINLYFHFKNLQTMNETQFKMYLPTDKHRRTDHMKYFRANV